MCILREEFPDHFKCLSLDNLDLLTMLYLEHKDTFLKHYVNDTLKDDRKCPRGVILFVLKPNPKED